MERFTVYGSCGQLRECLHASRSWRPWINLNVFVWNFHAGWRVEIPNQSIQIDPTTANFTTTARETARETAGHGFAGLRDGRGDR